jgi:hypothetical protein
MRRLLVLVVAVAAWLSFAGLALITGALIAGVVGAR